MNAKELVGYFKKEKENTLETYFSEQEHSLVSELIGKMNLSEEQRSLIYSVLDAVLTDTYYSLLLGLDGTGSIGGMQQTFKIIDETGAVVSECGELESEAWEQFHGE